MKKITKREVLFFILGLIAMLLIETVYDWNGSVKAFKSGWNSVVNVEHAK